MFHKVKANDERVVTLSVDGQRRGYATDAATVSDVLARARVRLNANDLVEPSLDTQINTAVFYINVYRAQPVIVVDGGREIKVETPYQHPKLIAERSAHLKVYAEDEYQTEPIRDILALGTIGYKLKILRSLPATLSVDGRTFKVRSRKATVAEMLAEKGIVLSSDDVLSVKRGARFKAGMHIRVIRGGKEAVAEEQIIAYPVQTIFDNNKPAGYEDVRQEGVNGKRLVTYEVKYRDGKEISRKVLQSVELVKAVPKIVVRSANFAGGVWAALRNCEAGGNYSTNTGNGFYGAYQFTISTWQSNAPGAYANTRPDLAPPSAQDAAAQNLQSRRGWGPWPACSRKLGLL